MSAPYHNLKRKVETAIQTVVAAKIALNGSTVLADVVYAKGFGLTNLSAAGYPRIEILCPRVAMESYGGVVTGNGTCDVVVAMVDHKDEEDIAAAPTLHDSRAAELIDYLMDDGFVTSLNGAAVTDFHVFHPDAGLGQPGWMPMEIGDDVADGEYRTTLTARCYCAPRTFS